MRVKKIFSRATALVGAVAMISAALLASASATVGVDFIVPVPNAPLLKVSYSDDIGRTPAELNRDYVLTQVRNVKLIVDGATNTDVFSSMGPSTNCTDPDINLEVGLAVARGSHLDLHLEYDQWNDDTQSWDIGKVQTLADIPPGSDPGNATVPICGS